MIDLIWNIVQQKMIADVTGDASDAKREVNRQGNRLGDIEKRVDRLALVSQALWELLRSRLGCTDADLIAKITEVDLRDGRKDGQISTRITTCPECARTVSSKRDQCLYCGAVTQKPHLFE